MTATALPTGEWCPEQTRIMGEIKASNTGAHKGEMIAEADLALPKQNENPGKN